MLHTIITIIGARPQFVKAAVVSRALRAKPGVRELLVHTGQHYDAQMSEVFFRELEIPQPDYALGIGSGSHGAQTGRMLEAIEGVLLEVAPSTVLVYGDTNSTLAGALAAAKLHIPVAHVEAGLRSYNRRMPEEINRVLTDHVAAQLFAPTEVAVENLRREGIDPASIHQVGDVMYDAALFYAARAEAKAGLLSALGLERRGYVLATIHRAENTDDAARLLAIFAGIAEVAREIPVVMPLHPRTVTVLAREAPGVAWPGLHIIDPVGYLEMLLLEKHARLIITDSGGVQKEAYFQRVPCVTLRGETEWTELVATGWNSLVPPNDAPSITAGIRRALDHPGQPVDLYGGGDAAARIAALLAGDA